MKNKSKLKRVFALGVPILALTIGITLSFFDMQKRNNNYWEYRVGKMVSFGKYEQDNNYDNGSEAIEWIVIDKKDGKVLLLAKNCLYARKSKNNNGGWKESDLRKWLNNSFYKNAFNKHEKKSLINTTSNCYGTKTSDKVFVLSYEELEKYLHMDLVRKTVPTKYVSENFKDNLAFDGENCETWIRNNDDFGYVEEYDEIYYGGNFQGIPSGEIAGVRPAIWVDVSKIK